MIANDPPLAIHHRQCTESSRAMTFLIGYNLPSEISPNNLVPSMLFVLPSSQYPIAGLRCSAPDLDSTQPLYDEDQ
jgi:hypothetical protein